MARLPVATRVRAYANQAMGRATNDAREAGTRIAIPAKVVPSACSQKVYNEDRKYPLDLFFLLVERAT